MGCSFIRKTHTYIIVRRKKLEKIFRMVGLVTNQKPKINKSDFIEIKALRSGKDPVKKAK